MGTKCSFAWQSSGQAVRLTTFLHLVPRSQIMGALTLLPHPPAWYVQRLYLLYQGNLVFISLYPVTVNWNSTSYFEISLKICMVKF